MYALRRVGLPPLHRAPRQAQWRGPCLTRRSFSVQALSEGFLDLATALPLPPSLPPYSTTIILVTVVSRILITLPVSIWAARRRWRLQDIVQPTIENMVPKVQHSIAAEMKANGETVVPTKDYQTAEGRAMWGEKFKKTVIERTYKIVRAREQELLDKYNCRTSYTLLLPIASQLPLFIGTSMVLNDLSRIPTPFDSESIFTLTSLAHVDPTATLPIVVGLLTFANVESSEVFMTDSQRERKATADAQRLEKRKEGVELGRLFKPAMRIASIIRVLVATMVPGSVVLYWVTSATFGLLQTWAIDYWGLRTRRITVLPSSDPAPLPPPSHPPPPKKSNQRKS